MSSDVRLLSPNLMNMTPQVNTWMPITQEPPDAEISVLVCQAGTDDYAVAHLTGEPLAPWRYADTGLQVPWPVTHWMDLPEIPPA